ncbi:MAG: flagellar biosynthesis anti-sigma factor FlgM [Nitrospira sp.]|nr:flagellar biosynthesis anti-sigma factor FlgM [Nitrospira sp.]MCP9442991.1 flagellar biosynthesis anti-sigma factor FlgM [Nitrospira sp.]
MHISGNGKTDHLAKLLLGVQDLDGSGVKSQPVSREVVRDQVHISERAKELQRILTLTEQPDPARVERINRIKQEIDNGIYDVSGRKVGDALIRHVLTDAIV